MDANSMVNFSVWYARHVPHKMLDERRYRDWLVDLRQQARRYPGLTRTAIDRFVKHPCCRAYRRDEIVDSVFAIFVTGQAITHLFTDGIKAMKIGVYDYLVHGGECFIARGTGETIETFQEQERLSFFLKAE